VHLLEPLLANLFGGFQPSSILNVPASQAQITAVEDEYGDRLPDSIHKLYTCANGEAAFKIAPSHPLEPPTNFFLAIFGGFVFLNLEIAAIEYEKSKRIFGNKNRTGSPPGRLSYPLYNTTWFPFARCNTAYLFINPENEHIYLINHEYGRRTFKLCDNLTKLVDLLVGLHKDNKIDVFFSSLLDIHDSEKQHIALHSDKINLLNFVEKEHSIL